MPIQETLSKTDRLSSTEGSSLSEQVYDYLADQIITGKISFGDRLNIKQIAAQLNVSTIPIRDAIKRLEQEKVVVVMPRSHCYVRIPTKKATLDAIDSRRMIELFVVNTVVETIAPSDLEPLDAVVEAMRPLAEESHIEEHLPSVSEYIDLDRIFHTSLVALSRNEYIMEFYKQVNMHLSMSFSYGIGVCHGIASTFAEHEAILDHLHHNRPEAAEVLENHLLKSRENILREARFQSLSE
ncbi:MAG: GntR family transcriptional regulator [Alkalispirochaetaceae bacterium]